MADALSRGRWRLLRAAQGLGLPGVVAGGVLLAAALAWLAVSLPGAQQLERLEAGNARLAREVAAARDSGHRDAPLTSSVQLAGFEAGFPAASGLSRSYARLWELARRHGLRLRQADFQLADPAQDAIARYAIVLPLSAEYVPLRAFVAEALRDNPALALQEMSLRRADAQATQLEARLRFVLFVRPRE
jgi:hypothetical protein